MRSQAEDFHKHTSRSKDIETRSRDNCDQAWKPLMMRILWLLMQVRRTGGDVVSTSDARRQPRLGPRTRSSSQGTRAPKYRDIFENIRISKISKRS